MSGADSRLCMSLPLIGNWVDILFTLLQDKPPPDDGNYQTYINITLLLLQTIGLFHQNPQQRALSIRTHGIVLQVI